MAHTLRLEIITPAGVAFADDVELVVIPGIEGELGIYPMHVPLMTEVKPGELRILKAGAETLLAIGDGFAEITQDHVSIVADLAIEATAIDENNVQKAIERAEAALKNAQNLSSEEYAAFTSTLEKSLVQMRVKRRGR